MSKLFRAYERKIRNTNEDYDLKGLMINISQDCSAYKLGWEEFMTLRTMILNKKELAK